jgi:hypothetical protein
MSFVSHFWRFVTQVWSIADKMSDASWLLFSMISSCYQNK